MTTIVNAGPWVVRDKHGKYVESMTKERWAQAYKWQEGYASVSYEPGLKLEKIITYKGMSFKEVTR